MEYNRLVRNKAIDSLKNQGLALKGKILKGEQLQSELYSLFWCEFNKTFEADKNHLIVHYAEMLEVLKALIVTNKVTLKSDTNQPIKWYKNFADKDKRLIDARTDLLQRFYELLNIKNKEVLKDQLNDVLDAYKDLVYAHGIDFAKTESVRRDLWNKFGGYTKGEKGVYIKTISKTASIEQNSIAGR